MVLQTLATVEMCVNNKITSPNSEARHNLVVITTVSLCEVKMGDNCFSPS